MPGFVAALALGGLTGATVGAFIARIAISFAISAITKKLFKPKASKPTQANEPRDRRYLLRSSDSPRRVVYGEVGWISGQLVYATTTGSKNEIVHMIVAVAGHECDAITGYKLDDEVVGALDGNGNVTTGRFANRVRLVPHLGSAMQTPHADLVAEVPAWTNNHAGKGVCWVWVRLDFTNDDGKVFRSGPPTPRFVIRGKKDIYDPRGGGSTGYTNNAVLCCLDYLRGAHGYNAPDAEIDLAFIESQADIADEWAPAQDSVAITSSSVANPTVITAPAHGLKTGQTVQIAGHTGSTPDINGEHVATVTGTNTYTIPVNVTVGGTGGTSQHVERRYTCNGSFTRDGRLREIMEDLLSSCLGTAAPLRGRWRIHAAAAGTVTRAPLTEDDIRGPITIRPRPGRDDIFNAVRGTYVDPSRQWAVTDFPIVTNATYETQDNGERIFKDMDFKFTTSAYAAQRLGRIELDRARNGLIFEVPVKKTALDVAFWDLIEFDLDAMGWVAKQFRVVDFRLESQGQITLLLQADDATSYDDDPSTIFVPGAEQTLIWNDGATVGDPSDLTIQSGTSYLRQGSDGTVISVARLDWTPSSSAWVQAYRIEYKPQAAGDWLPGPVVGPSTFQAEVPGLTDGITYDFRLRAESRGGHNSAWVTDSHTIVGKTAPPSDVTGFSVTAGADGFLNLSWNAVADVDVISGGGYEVRYSTGSSINFDTATPVHEGLLPSSPQRDEWILADGTYSFAIKAVDTSGNKSDNAATVLGVQTAHPQNVDPPADLVLESGTGHLYLKPDGTVVSRLKVAWTDPVHVSAVGISLQISRDGITWEPAKQIELGLGLAYVWDVEPGVNYTVRIRSRAQRDYTSAWVQDTHTVIGKLAPPTAPTGLTVMPDLDGFLTVSWTPVSDVDVIAGGGYQVRFKLGATFDWPSATNLHDGNLTATKFRVEFPVGDAAYSFGVKAIDSSGNESASADTDLNISTTHPQNVDDPTGLTLTSGASTAYVKDDGTVVSRILIEWTDPTHPGAEAIGIEFQRAGGGWEPAGSVEIGVQQAYLWDVETGIGYNVRIRSRARRGFVGTWVTELNHTVVGKTTPPPNPSQLVVNTLADGTREYRWDIPSKPADLRGYQLRYKAGTGHAWADLDGQLADESTGILPGSPYESTQLAAGTYTFGVAAVDTTGNVSGTPKVVEATLGDPPIEGAVDQLDLLRDGWPGQKVNCEVGVFSVLRASEGAGQTWANMGTWDGNPDWIIDSLGSWEYRHEDGLGDALIDLGFDATFTPLLALTLDNVNVVTEWKWKTDGGSYQGSWQTVTSPITARYVRFRLTCTTIDTGEAALITQALFVAAATPVEEVINDLDTSMLTDEAGGGWRLPINETYGVITNVQIALQNVGAGWSWELIDKDPAQGPHIKIYNATPALADATIDAYVRGL